MNLPETIRSPNGLTVPGAGPEMLRELLAAYEFELSKQDPKYVAAMQPGLTRDEVVATLQGAGAPDQPCYGSERDDQ